MGPPTTDEIAQTDREIKQAEARFGWGSVIWGFGFGVAAGMAINQVARLRERMFWIVVLLFVAVGVLGAITLIAAGQELSYLRKCVHSGPRAPHEHICKTCLEKSLAANGGIRFRQECSDYDCKIPEDVDSCSECLNASSSWKG